MHPDTLDRRIIHRLSQDIGTSFHPFKTIADELGVEESEILERLKAYKHSGALRRFGAVLRHTKAGYKANGMSTWNVPDEKVDEVGAILAKHSAISHCYERPRFPGWIYNMYGMIHGTSEEEVRSIATALSQELGISEYDVLFSRQEFKKSSMVFFPAEENRR